VVNEEVRVGIDRREGWLEMTRLARTKREVDSPAKRTIAELHWKS
jgi:hypothetical protein